MYLRFYAHVADTTYAMAFYQDVFFGIPNKNAGKKQGHNSIKLFDKPELNILIYGPMPESEMNGSLILRFADDEAELFEKVNARLQARDDIQIRYFRKSYLWGTTITRFTDPFGYNWSIEISTDALTKADA